MQPFSELGQKSLTASRGYRSLAGRDAPLQGFAEAGHQAVGGARAAPRELLHLYARHGLPAELRRQLGGA
jgi:hypothetical protein